MGMSAASLSEKPMSVNLGARCSASVTIEMLDDTCTTVSAQNARVLSACFAVNSGSSSSSCCA